MHMPADIYIQKTPARDKQWKVSRNSHDKGKRSKISAHCQRQGERHGGDIHCEKHEGTHWHLGRSQTLHFPSCCFIELENWKVKGLLYCIQPKKYLLFQQPREELPRGYSDHSYLLSETSLADILGQIYSFLNRSFYKRMLKFHNFQWKRECHDFFYFGTATLQFSCIFQPPATLNSLNRLVNKQSANDAHSPSFFIKNTLARIMVNGYIISTL